MNRQFHSRCRAVRSSTGWVSRARGGRGVHRTQPSGGCRGRDIDPQGAGRPRVLKSVLYSAGWRRLVLQEMIPLGPARPKSGRETWPTKRPNIATIAPCLARPCIRARAPAFEIAFHGRHRRGRDSRPRRSSSPTRSGNDGRYLCF